MAVDILARASANKAATKVDNLSSGITWRGEVNYYSDLPLTPKIGDGYVVKYQGSEGTEPLGVKYVWGTTAQWIDFGRANYTAGNGISIVNGVVSLNLPNLDEGEY